MRAGDGTKRARTPRGLTNVSTLGELYLKEVHPVMSFLNDVDSILLTDCADNRETESCQESLDCAEHSEWRAACAQKRRGLQHLGGTHVVPIPPGVISIMSRKVCKRKWY